MNIKIYFLVVTMFAFILGCSHYGTINKKVHRFVDSPQKIIWYHVAGLDEEHVSLLKYFYRDSKIGTAFENSTCMGKMWRYNLYDIRPSSVKSFISQVSGTKNVNNQCDALTFRPIWSYLKKQDYSTGFLEASSKIKTRNINTQQCGDVEFGKDVVWWKLQQPIGGLKPNQGLFHIQEQIDFQAGSTYFDKSCTNGTCYNNLNTNLKGLVQNYFERQGNYLFVIKDNSLLDSLKKKDLKGVKTNILNIESVVDYLYKLQAKNPEMLVLVTTSEPIPVELPDSGKEWKNFIENKSNLLYRKSSVLSTVWAKGVRSENFCGMFEEAEILQRVMNNYTEKRLELLGVPIM